MLVLIFDLNQLIDMMSIGTLLAYSLVSACTLVLRYRPTEDSAKKYDADSEDMDGSDSLRRRSLKDFLFGQSDEPLMRRLLIPKSNKCNSASAQLVVALTIVAGKELKNVLTSSSSLFYQIMGRMFFVLVLDIITICVLLNVLEMSQPYAIAIVCVLGVIVLLITALIWRQPQNLDIDSFKVTKIQKT